MARPGTDLKSVVLASRPARVVAATRRQAQEDRRRAGEETGCLISIATIVKAMVEGHQDLTAKLESRLDVQSLADWKTAAAGRSDSKALPEPKTAMPDVQVRPNKSDNDVTMKINQWAADTYPSRKSTSISPGGSRLL